MRLKCPVAVLLFFAPWVAGIPVAVAKDAGRAPMSPFEVNRVCIDLGPEVTPSLKASLLTRLGEVPGTELEHDPARCGGDGRSVVLSVGTTTLSSQLIGPAEMADLSDEGFVIRFEAVRGRNIVAVKGRSAIGAATNIGIGLGLFHLLESMGFSFLHPLDPLVPRRLGIDPEAIDTAQSPRWRVRGIHLHTMHPIELTQLLNGWGQGGPGDSAGFTNSLQEWRHFLEWMLANKLNRVQWVLLSSSRWRIFDQSSVRLERLTELVRVAHDYGIQVGVDAPIVMRQQNAFRLLTRTGNPKKEKEELRRRIDWLMGAGFDFLATELGTSEFTHPGAGRMLGWMNEMARHLDERHGQKRAYVKVHVSSGQLVDGMTDPVSKGPLNVNFLPYYADPRIGVMPHTVELYGLDDPAPVYGNEDFSSIARYMALETPRREVIWYPETAYWCSFDIDVPLFLPVYGERRLRDLRIIARREEAEGMAPSEHIAGQVFFSSGWEWGYWLNDVVAARASWNPDVPATECDDLAFRKLLSKVFASFGDASAALVDLVHEIAAMERHWLIRGANQPGEESFFEQLTGQAYLQGEDTLDDMARLLEPVTALFLTSTQPKRANLLYGLGGDSRDHLLRIGDLLARMENGLREAEGRFTAIYPRAPRESVRIVRELHRSLSVTRLRAVQSRALFAYAVGRARGATDGELSILAGISSRAIDEAGALVKEQELAYRVDADRIASWTPNPTAYRFGYLWSVRDLLYWRRDHARVVDNNRKVCFENVIDPFEVSFGHAFDSPRFRLIRRLARLLVGDELLDDCFSPTPPRL